MHKFIGILGGLAVVAGSVGAAVGTVNPKAGAVIAGVGGAALAVTKPLLDVQAGLDRRREQKARRRAANR